MPWGLTLFLGDYCPDPTTVFLRRGVYTPASMFEKLVAEWCRQFGHLQYRWIVPDLENGAGAVFLRDNEMVDHSDLVLAFLSEEGMVGGTAHVVETAIDRGVPVYSFIVGESVTRLGEVDPTDSWGPVIEEAFSE